MKSFVKVATVGEVAEGKMKEVEVAGKEVMLVNLAGEYFALSNLCTHSEGLLSLGTLESDSVECPDHGSQFNVRTGAVESGPADEPVHSYAVRIEGKDILVGPG